jgi:hypothetical protein
MSSVLDQKREKGGQMAADQTGLDEEASVAANPAEAEQADASKSKAEGAKPGEKGKQPHWIIGLIGQYKEIIVILTAIGAVISFL